MSSIFIMDVYEQYETDNVRTSDHEVWLPREDSKSMPKAVRKTTWQKHLFLILSLPPPKSWLVLTNPTLYLITSLASDINIAQLFHSITSRFSKNNVWSLVMMLMTHIWQMISLYFVVKKYPSHRKDLGKRT